MWLLGGTCVTSRAWFFWRKCSTFQCITTTSDFDTQRRVRSADTAMLVVPSIRSSTLGDRAFPVSSARAWNSLLSSVRNAPSFTTFRRELKTTFSVVVWQWLGDRDCTAQYNCCLPATTDCRSFCPFCLLFYLFRTVSLQCLWQYCVTLVSTLLLTYSCWTNSCVINCKFVFLKLYYTMRVHYVVTFSVTSSVLSSVLCQLCLKRAMQAIGQQVVECQHAGRASPLYRCCCRGIS